MTDESTFEIFLTAAPGLEQALLAEARELQFSDPRAVPGGVTVQGGWPEVWRANLALRGAGTDDVGTAAPAENQPQRIEQDRLARPGLAGQHVQPRVELQCQAVDDEKIADFETAQHVVSYPSFVHKINAMRRANMPEPRRVAGADTAGVSGRAGKGAWQTGLTHCLTAT